MSNDITLGGDTDSPDADHTPPCPRCGHGLVEAEGYMITHQCNNCGSLWNHARIQRHRDS